MYLFDLGKLPGQQSMLVFHALARMGVEALVIVSPSAPDAMMKFPAECRELGIKYL